jgi:sulfur relay (sulfurtransferase) complex TusBCD TusD component (DsrE family)
LQAQWQAFHCPLVICVNAGRNYGIVSDQEAQQYEPSISTLAPSFTIGGLGTLAEAKRIASKVIEFGH